MATHARLKAICTEKAIEMGLSLHLFLKAKEGFYK